MQHLNRISILGNTGKHEPKTGATQSGVQVTRLTVATNKRYQEKGEWKSTPPSWHNVAVFGAAAEYASRIEPGSLVFVEGEMTHRTYEKEIDTDKGPVKVEWPIWEIVASRICAIKNKGPAA